MCQATGLRCFRHFYHNCHDKLHKLRIQIKEEQKFFLEAVVGKGQVSDGILDAKDKHDLKNRLLEAKGSLEGEEERFNGRSAHGVLDLYQRSQEDDAEGHDRDSSTKGRYAA